MKKIVSASITGMIALFVSCYHNSLEELSNPDGCNTSDIRYDRDVRRIISISCNMSGCHNTNSTTTFSLVTYEDLKAQVDNGLLLKSINHEPGVSAMPQNVSKLSDCTIDKITAWVNSGAPNN